jgi:phage terminase Nu1 subunit (DNA packaging protein)
MVAAAAILGVHRNTLSKWIDQGCPVITKADRSIGAEWEIHIPDVVEWRIRRAVDDAVARYGGGADRITKDEADRRRAVAQAITAEVETDETLRSVVSVADVLDVVTQEYAAVRTHLQSVGSKVAGRAATMTSAPAIQELVDEAIIDALEALTHDGRLAEDRAAQAG